MNVQQVNNNNSNSINKKNNSDGSNNKNNSNVINNRSNSNTATTITTIAAEVTTIAAEAKTITVTVTATMTTTTVAASTIERLRFDVHYCNRYLSLMLFKSDWLLLKNKCITLSSHR